jgi:AraC-like DNA-binding protein
MEWRGQNSDAVEVVRARRLARARAEVTASDRPISVIAHRWGFSDTCPLQPHLEGPLRPFTDRLPQHLPLRRPGFLTHQFKDLSRRFKPLTHRVRRLVSQRFNASGEHDCGGSRRGVLPPLKRGQDDDYGLRRPTAYRDL